MPTHSEEDRLFRPEVRAGPVGTLVERGAHAEIAAAGHELDPPVPGGELLRNLHAVVGRGVVHDENAYVSVPLGQDARDTLAQESAVPIAGNDDVHAGCRPI